MTEGGNDKDSSENRLWLRPFALPFQYAAKTSSTVTDSSLMLWVCLSYELFAHFAISPRILNTPATLALIWSLHK